MEAHLAQVPVGSRGLRQRVDCTSIDTTPSHAPPKFRAIKESSSYQLSLARLELHMSRASGLFVSDRRVD